METPRLRVFVTGATGFVGSAVVRELLAHGHRVVGLSRSPQGAATLAAAGAEALAGTLDDLEILARGAAESDAVIHTAFDHDFSRFEANAAQDRRAIEALGASLVGSERPLLVASGLAVTAAGPLRTERDRAVAPSPAYPRASEAAVDTLLARGVRAAAVRLPPTVHGDGDHGFIRMIVERARERGASAYIADGANRWSAVHRLDAARAFRLALERGATGGPFHAVAEEGVPFRAIAEAIGRQLAVPIIALTADAAADHFGWLAHFASIDMPASSAHTRALLGWSPSEPDLLADLAGPAYYT